MNRFLLATTALLALLPTVALAAFVCKPPGGSTIMRDEPPPECAGVDIRELFPDGSLKRIIAAPLTPEQEKARAEKEKRQAECAEQNKAWSQENEALLTRYHTEDDLQDARYDAIGRQLKQVNEANARLKEIIARGKELTEKRRFFEPPHSMPANLQADSEANSELEQRQIRVIEDAAHGIHHINDLFDADLKRYRDIVTGQAKPPFQCEE